ncbi:MAG: phosphoribosylamine--glycine ligase [Chitinophagaceae bacterium]|jgi:phosphoribosylamine--glycine ligase|nr:phosphoribosylamine--glycine ligase [Chitinophagaceae bacterium]OQY93423.1 MAG: phosphoribosylamine--glycine ligase [Sphingobacteriales bacterium UTBCD1]
MRILLLGSGGREHALAWKLNQSVWTNPLYIAPGNPGTALCGKNVSLDIRDFEAVGNFCYLESIDMIVVGPEEPLVNGLYDYFKSKEELKKIYFIGPSQKGAQLEGSKAFAKAFMQRHKIPTAKYGEFTMDNYDEGVKFLQDHDLPVVIKADGLAAGKGVVICKNHVEAIAEFELLLHHGKFGEASKKVVVEEFLDGIEFSVFVLTDGKNYVILPEAKDYKRVGVGDEGMNTGGMGAVSPLPFVTRELMQRVEKRIIRPTINGLKKENIEYTGFIYFGLINVKGEPYVIEYNCRMGDPEAEVVLPRMENDIVGLFVAATQKELDKVRIRIDKRTAATVVAVSGGYPAGYETGYEITGIDQNFGKQTLIFQAGTREKDGKILTNGGRVLCVTSYGENIKEAVASSLEVLEHIDFTGIYYRNDIGYEFVPKPSAS